MKKRPIFIFLILVAIISIGAWYVNKKGDENLPGSQLTLISEVTYVCDNNKTIQAAFYEGEFIPVEPGEPPIPSGEAKIVLSDGRSLDLPQTISASGVRYANSDESFIFWIKGENAMVLEGGAEKDFKGCVVSGSESEIKGIKVTFPNGGEVWSKGEKVKISWETEEGIESVNIRLGIFSDEGGQTFNAPIVSGTPNSGEYEWTVQELYAEVWGVEDLPVSDKYFVLVEDVEHSNVYDKSDTVFSITD